MKRKWRFLIAVLVAVALYRSFFFVNETEMIIVTQFGRPVRTLREAGLSFKLPYQSVLRIDRRMNIYDPRPSEFLAKQKKNVNLDVFVLWRVEDPHRFIETVNDPTGAEARIHDLVWSELAAEVGRNELEALVSLDPETHRIDALVEAVTNQCAGTARSDYGIGILGVHLKRIGLPEQVRESVFQRMRAERARIARQYRAEGEEQALKIRADADKERTVVLAKAYAEAERTRGAGEAEATRIYTEAHERDPEFYELLRTLEAYEKFLDDKTTMLLSAGSDLLKYLTRPSEPKPSRAPTTHEDAPERN